MHDMAKYMVLIYGDQQRWDAMTPEERQALHEGHRSFAASAGTRILSSGELQPPPMATTVRSDAGGRVVTTDGPFLEVKEVLGGYYLVDAADLDDVLALVAELAEVHAVHSAVEIRPLVDHG
jgi:hypothetical protein